MHPLDPLSPGEISKAAEIVKGRFHGEDLIFRVITLKEPIKKQMVVFLAQEHAGELNPACPPRLVRVHVNRMRDGCSQFFELTVDLDRGEVTTQEHLVGRHSHIDSAFMQAVERACLADERVQSEIELLKLPAEAQVVVEPWAYATDGVNDMSERTTMCWFYLRLYDNPDTNYYAYPLDLCAEVSEALQVTKIYRLPSSAEEQIHNTSTAFDEHRIHPPAESEYHPSLRPPPRTSTKPLHITQPEGASFRTDDNLLIWEKWRMRVGFNYREGLTLHDIRFDDRNLFYRLSLAEMFVPYGDPRAPYPRKAAFDLGNDGAGINANNLQLGCDCLGLIKYFDGWHNTSSGEPLKLPNVVCCHEQDDGILWKHTNHRTGNAVVARSRVLVLQTIITVSNYEYVFAFHFGQDASIHYEVRATGILSTAPINLGDKVPYGTIVAPGTLAPNHQHLFSIRIDPAIDGHANSLLVEESCALSTDDPKVHNPFGVGYVTKSTAVENEGGLDLDLTKNRTFKIVNANKTNPVTGTAVGFKLLPHYSQMLLAHPSSYHYKRSEFAEHAIWVTRYDDEETFPSGRYTMQSLGGEGIASGIKKRREAGNIDTSVRNADIVVWHTFGSTHNPRIEDWPVMPSERMVVGLKPINFFSGNPSLDVAPSTRTDHCSVEIKKVVSNGVDAS